jgi:hypothetical protein
MHHYLAVISIPLWGMGFYLLGSRIWFFLTASRASGRLSGFKEVAGVQGRTYHYPTVVFQTPDGTEYSIVAATGSTGRHGSVHSAITVLYDARNPQKGMVHSIIHYWMAPIAFLVLAGGATFAYFDIIKPTK